MDRLDLQLALTLLGNSRLPYSELADRLNMSVNAVHKRLRALIQEEIIRVFTAKISLVALHALHVLVFGRSEATSFDEVRTQLGSHEATYWVAIAGGNYLYVGAYLRNIAELEPFVAFVRTHASMPDATVGIEAPPAVPPRGSLPRETALSSLDYQIIYALRTDARKHVSEVAAEIGVSAKTVQRRLQKMMREGSIELSIQWYPDASNDIMTTLHLYLATSADKGSIGQLLKTAYGLNLIFYWSFSNLPILLLGVVWTNTMKELRDIRERLEREEVFDSVMPNVLYTGYIFDTWRDTLVLERGVPTRSTRKRD